MESRQGRGDSMRLDFVKLEGLGNDFVFFDDLSRELEFDKGEIRSICDRHFGIGADGVILVRPSDDADCVAYMHYINSDGTLAQMCGNGVRCFAKYLVDRGFVSEGADTLVADTLAGPRRIGFTRDDEGRLAVATVDMGSPILVPDEIPTTLAPTASFDGQDIVREAPIPSPWGDFTFTCISMGNPHAVCFIDDFESLPDEAFSDAQDKRLETLDLDRIGAFYESASVFPEKANIEFASVGEDGISMRVYERGCGETLACGTGACATGVAACLSGRAGRRNPVLLSGGTLIVEWADDGHVMMTGPAAESFTGVWVR